MNVRKPNSANCWAFLFGDQMLGDIHNFFEEHGIQPKLGYCIVGWLAWTLQLFVFMFFLDFAGAKGFGDLVLHLTYAGYALESVTGGGLLYFTRRSFKPKQKALPSPKDVKALPASTSVGTEKKETGREKVLRQLTEAVKEINKPRKPSRSERRKTHTERSIANLKSRHRGPEPGLIYYATGWSVDKSGRIPVASGITFPEYRSGTCNVEVVCRGDYYELTAQGSHDLVNFKKRYTEFL